MSRLRFWWRIARGFAVHAWPRRNQPELHIDFDTRRVWVERE